MADLIQQQRDKGGLTLLVPTIRPFPKIETRELNFFYGERQALFDIDVRIPQTMSRH